MIEIRNTNLFEKIMNSTDMWNALFKDDAGTIEDFRIPVFFGGLDHIDIKKNGIYFHDIGSNDKDNSFVIRKEVGMKLDEMDTEVRCPECGALHKHSSPDGVGWWEYETGKWACDCNAGGLMWFSGDVVSGLGSP